VEELSLLEQAPTIEELAAALASDLNAKGIPPEFAAEIAQKLTQEFALFEAPAPDPGTLGFLFIPGSN
jgi:hypothetical protein